MDVKEMMKVRKEAGEKGGDMSRIYYWNIIGTTGSTYVNVRITCVIFCTSKQRIKLFKQNEKRAMTVTVATGIDSQIEETPIPAVCSPTHPHSAPLLAVLFRECCGPGTKIGNRHLMFR